VVLGGMKMNPSYVGTEPEQKVRSNVPKGNGKCLVGDAGTATAQTITPVQTRDIRAHGGQKAAMCGVQCKSERMVCHACAVVF